MNKVILTTLLFCIGVAVVGCEKTHSVEEFKKDKELFKEWEKKCGEMGPSSIEKSKNCRNAAQAYMELFIGR